MFDCVVDTSIAVKWILKESDSVAALSVMNEVLSQGGSLHYLDIAAIEAANVFWVNHHRKKISDSEARRLLKAFGTLPLSLLAALPLLDDAFDIALQYRVAVYDACFVAAVQKLGCRGVTADVPLVQKVGAAFPSIVLLQDW